MKDMKRMKKPAALFTKKGAGTKKNESDSNKIYPQKGESPKAGKSAKAHKLDGIKI